MQAEGNNDTRVSVCARDIVNMSFSGQQYNHFTSGMMYFNDNLSMPFDSNRIGNDITPNRRQHQHMRSYGRY